MACSGDLLGLGTELLFFLVGVFTTLVLLGGLFTCLACYRRCRSSDANSVAARTPATRSAVLHAPSLSVGSLDCLSPEHHDEPALQRGGRVTSAVVEKLDTTATARSASPSIVKDYLSPAASSQVGETERGRASTTTGFDTVTATEEAKGYYYYAADGGCWFYDTQSGESFPADNVTATFTGH